MSDTESEERWRGVIGWPGYEVSSLGNVKGHGRSIHPFPNSRGYLCFNVCGPESTRKMLRVHREVARAFLDGSGLARHLDGNKMNCKLSNLSWGTHVDNEADKKRHGRNLCGETHHQHKLTESQVFEARASDTASKELADRWGVRRETVWRARTGRKWRHLV